MIIMCYEKFKSRPQNRIFPRTVTARVVFLSTLINELCICFSTGEYYSLSCEPTLGESQIFHSMVKRQPIRTRDAIKLIGDGQEQKLKKDRVIESWIKVKLYTHHLGCHATFLTTKAPKHCVTFRDCMTY